MKTFKRNLTTALLLAAAALSLTLSSCQKEFDSKTYRPSKPLPPPPPPPSYDGFEASKDIEPGAIVGYWPFNGDLTDSITNAKGVATGTTFGTGIAGQSFQGALNAWALCDAPAGLATLQSTTISLWVNTPPPSTGIIGFFTLVNTQTFWGNIEMFFENGSDNTNGKVRIHFSQNNSDFTYSIDNVANLFNAWVNIAVSYDQTDGTCVLYVNGVAANTGKAGSLTGALNFKNVGKVVFGTVQFMTTPSQTSGTTAQPWASFNTGQIDQVRVYNKVLPAAEINALYNLTLINR